MTRRRATKYPRSARVWALEREIGATAKAAAYAGEETVALHPVAVLAILKLFSGTQRNLTTARAKVKVARAALLAIEWSSCPPGGGDGIPSCPSCGATGPPHKADCLVAKAIGSGGHQCGEMYAKCRECGRLFDKGWIDNREWESVGCNDCEYAIPAWTWHRLIPNVGKIGDD